MVTTWRSILNIKKICKNMIGYRIPNGESNLKRFGLIHGTTQELYATWWMILGSYIYLERTHSWNHSLLLANGRFRFRAPPSWLTYLGLYPPCILTDLSVKTTSNGSPHRLVSYLLPRLMRVNLSRNQSFVVFLFGSGVVYRDFL